MRETLDCMNKYFAYYKNTEVLKVTFCIKYATKKFLLSSKYILIYKVSCFGVHFDQHVLS